MTQIFNSKEKENYEGSQKLKDRYREAKNAIEDEAARRRRAEDKYCEGTRRIRKKREVRKWVEETRRWRDENKRRDEERRREEIFIITGTRTPRIHHVL